MVLTGQFTSIVSCAPGGRFVTTLDTNPGPVGVIDSLTLSDINDPVTDEEWRVFARLLLRGARLQDSTATLVQLRTAVLAKVYNLTVGA